MKKISLQEYTDFVLTFSTNPHRFGQEFMNYFYPQNVVHKLFFSEDRVECVEIIFNDYIEFGE